MRFKASAVQLAIIPFLAGALILVLALPVLADPIRIVALGDSLTAGYDLPQPDSFPAQLQAALKAKGYDVEIANAGVSGDTSSDGLARLSWSVPDGTDAVLLELGGNDALRGIPPERTRSNLDKIISRLKKRNIKVLLIGILAPPNMGEAYASKFDPIFRDLAKKYDVVFYPFLLDGVATHAKLQLSDGIHPNPKGVSVIVQRVLPYAERLIKEVHTAEAK